MGWLWSESATDMKMSSGKKSLAVEKIFDDRKVRVMPSKEFDVKEIGAEMIRDHALEDAFFVCDIGAVIKKYAEWVKFIPRVRPFYAVKCNDSPLLLETLAAVGAGFDCASKVEMEKVIGMGIAPTDIIYANAAKPLSHIVAAAEFDIQTATLDTMTELYKLKKYLPNARLVIRIKSDAASALRSHSMKFGATLDEAKKILDEAKLLEMNVVGVSFHVGSGCKEPPVFLRAIKAAREVFDYAASELGYDMSLLDIGGGFPGDSGTSIKEISEYVNLALENYFPEECGVEIISEPGRYFAASAFTLFAQIHSIKETQTSQGDQVHYMYSINEGTHGALNWAAALFFENKEFHPEIFQRSIFTRDREKFESSVWGQSCDGMDQVCSRIQLPKMEVGEWLAFSDLGAYSLANGTTFNGFPLPKIHTVASPESWKILESFWSSKSLYMYDARYSSDNWNFNLLKSARSWIGLRRVGRNDTSRQIEYREESRRYSYSGESYDSSFSDSSQRGL